MSEEEAMLDIDGSEVSLADIAGLDMSEVEEVRGFTFPKGLFLWSVVEAGLDTRDAKGVPTAVINFKLQCENVEAIDDGVEAADFIGKNYTETFWIKDLQDDLGKVKAFMVDAGFEGEGSLQELLAGIIGTEFMAKIKHAKDKNDKSITYANLDRRSVTAVAPEAEA